MPPGRRLGSTASRFLRYLLPLCLLVAAVVAGQGLLRVISRTNATATTQADVSLTLGVAGKSPSAAASTQPSPSAEPSLAEPSASAKTDAPPAPVTSPVAIFNATAVRGLATRTAASLREQGVVVAAVENLPGGKRPALQTVFYSPGQEAQAHTLANLSGTSEVAPAPSWIPADGRLVLVLTDTTTNASGPLPHS